MVYPKTLRWKVLKHNQWWAVSSWYISMYKIIVLYQETSLIHADLVVVPLFNFILFEIVTGHSVGNSIILNLILKYYEWNREWSDTTNRPRVCLFLKWYCWQRNDRLRFRKEWNWKEGLPQNQHDSENFLGIMILYNEIYQDDTVHNWLCLFRNFQSQRFWT